MKKSSIHSVIYQIWPRSFNDSNNDGIGDIPGIISKLDYLKTLGINQIWLSPVFVSPNKDYGYDVQDYYNIQPEFGTMQDMNRLIKESKDRDISIIMDLVFNHTSDQHPWFQDALKDKQSKYRDYYYFRQGKNNKEPNNWISLFGGSAWTKLKNEDNMYYLSLFTPEQTDLNWGNPNVRKEVENILRFWLDKGISGFRMDVINIISKKEGLPDKNPHKKGYQFADDFIVSRELSHTYIQEMYENVLKDYPGLFIGEGLLINPDQAKRYSGSKSNELDLMFHFDTVLIGCGPLGKYDFRKLYRWTIKEFKEIFFKWQDSSVKSDFYLGNFLSNHDNGRAVSRFGNDKKYHSESAKALQTLIFTSRGTPFIYQGEEIGMTNMKIEIEDWKDFEAINDYVVLQSMMHLPKSISKRVVQKMTRDQARTPIQWSNKDYGGFSEIKPWMVVNPNYKEINVENQIDDPNSILNYTKLCISLYKSDECFAFGNIEPILLQHPELIAYRRFNDVNEYAIFINLSDKYISFKLDSRYLTSSIVLYNISPTLLNEKLIFRPYEAIVLKVK
jgi:oligo-1,6-glucosidase